MTRTEEVIANALAVVAASRATGESAMPNDDAASSARSKSAYRSPKIKGASSTAWISTDRCLRGGVGW